MNENSCLGYADRTKKRASGAEPERRGRHPDKLGGNDALRGALTTGLHFDTLALHFGVWE
jgi:hypothetical protein